MPTKKKSKPKQLNLLGTTPKVSKSSRKTVLEYSRSKPLPKNIKVTKSGNKTIVTITRKKSKSTKK